MSGNIRPFLICLRHGILLWGILCLCALSSLSAQTPGDSPEDRQNKVRIDLLYAQKAEANQRFRPDVQVLIGDVKLRHDSMYMYCDSALIYEKINSVEAFGNVRMEQGDTLFIYGDYLYYNGQTQLAQLREHVSLINRQARLDTDSLNYDRLLDYGYYFEGGTLTDEENVLTSSWGEYSPQTKQAYFNYDVVLENDRMTLHSDTLEYNTDSKIAYILGPSVIDSEDGQIISDFGVYHTDTEQAHFLNRSVIVSDDRTITADSLFYDRKNGVGEGFWNVQMNDTVNKNVLYGDYCFYDENQGSAFATDNAYGVDYSQGDSLFVRADTLRLVTYNINTDSMHRQMRAYHRVRAYRQDLQAVCDSMVFNSLDSCLIMYTQPVIWNGNDQLLGEEIRVYMNDSTIDWAHIVNQALVVEAFDSLRYNQVSGKEMMAYFDNGEARTVDVNGSVMVIYYPVDDKDSTAIGMDYTEGSFLRMELRDQKMERGVFRGKASGTLYPLDQIPGGKDRLSAFVWLDEIRPRSRDDIFDVRERKDDKILEKVDRKPSHTPRQMNIRH